MYPRVMRDPFKRLRGAPVVIHLRSGRSVAGTVWTSSRGVIELRSPIELVSGRSVALDGALCVPRESIDFYQLHVELPNVAVRVAA